MRLLFLATRNYHKVREIQAVLGREFDYLTLNDVPAAPAVQEDAPTFAGNARKKAETLAQWLADHPDQWSFPGGTDAARAQSAWVLADDSGLEVDALDGAPGVRSARFAALDPAGTENTSDTANNDRLLALLVHVPPTRRTARFRCAIALAPLRPAGLAPSGSVHPTKPTADSTLLFEGVCEGRIGPAPEGGGGFGYDPLFYPDGYPATFAALGEATKNQISHRARALAKVRSWCDL